MLLALLYEDDGVLAAAALACDQQPYGDRYWREIHPAGIEVRQAETAYVEITDEDLVERLLQMDFENGIQAAEAVDQYLGLHSAGVSGG